MSDLDALAPDDRRRPGQGLLRRRPVAVLSPDAPLGGIRVRVMPRARARRRAVLGEDRRQPAGVEEHDLGRRDATVPSPRSPAGRRSPCRCRSDRAPSRRATPPSGSPRRPAPSARRSRVRASGCRSRCRQRRRRRPSRSAASASAASWRTSGTPTLTPLATPTASTSGRSCLAEVAQQRPPGDQPGVGAAAGGRVDDRRRPHVELPALLDELDVADQVAQCSGRRAATDRDRVRGRSGRGQLVVELLAGDLQLAPVVRRTAHEVQLGAEQLGEQLVPRRRGPGASPDSTRCTSRPSTAPAAAVIRQWLDWLGSDGDERPGTGAQRLGAQELELAGLVAAGAEPRQVVALDPQPGPARQARSPLERGRQRRQA